MSEIQKIIVNDYSDADLTDGKKHLSILSALDILTDELHRIADALEWRNTEQERKECAPTPGFMEYSDEEAET